MKKSLYSQLENIGNIPYRQIDENVRNLVAALQYMGLEPDSSCEGHLAGYKHRHPQVGFKLDPSNPQFNKLDILVVTYSTNRKIKWWRNQVRQTRKLMPQTYSEMCSRCYGDKAITTTQEKLLELQTSAEELAWFLFEQTKYHK